MSANALDLKHKIDIDTKTAKDSNEFSSSSLINKNQETEKLVLNNSKDANEILFSLPNEPTEIWSQISELFLDIELKFRFDKFQNLLNSNKKEIPGIIAVALVMSVEKGYLNIVKYLFSRYVQFDKYINHKFSFVGINWLRHRFPTPDGFLFFAPATLLETAAFGGHLKIVQYLIKEKNADPNKGNVLLSVYSGIGEVVHDNPDRKEEDFLKIVQYLMEQGIDFDVCARESNHDLYELQKYASRFLFQGIAVNPNNFLIRVNPDILLRRERLLVEIENIYVSIRKTICSNINQAMIQPKGLKVPLNSIIYEYLHFNTASRRLNPTIMHSPTPRPVRVLMRVLTSIHQDIRGLLKLGVTLSAGCLDFAFSGTRYLDSVYARLSHATAPRLDLCQKSAFENSMMLRSCTISKEYAEKEYGEFFQKTVNDTSFLDGATLYCAIPAVTFCLSWAAVKINGKLKSNDEKNKDILLERVNQYNKQS